MTSSWLMIFYRPHLMHKTAFSYSTGSFRDICQIPHLSWYTPHTLPAYSSSVYVIETAWEICDDNLQSICDHMSPAVDDYNSQWHIINTIDPNTKWFTWMIKWLYIWIVEDMWNKLCSLRVRHLQSQIAWFMGTAWGPPGSCRPQMGPMLAPWTLLSGVLPSLYLLITSAQGTGVTMYQSRNK